MRNAGVLLTFIVGFLAGALGQSETRTPISSALISQQRAFPVAFEPNLGQAQPDFQFVGRQHGLYVGFGSEHIRFSLASNSGRSGYELWFRGASTRAIEGEQRLTGTVNYLHGNPSDWKIKVPTFARVRYRDLYPGIDLIFYGNGQQVEHDFVVGPGANPRNIVMSFDDRKAIGLDDDGSLTLGDGEERRIQFRKPIAFQHTSRGRVEVAVSYRIAGDKVAFQVGDYDRDEPLVIDPVLDYSTYVADDYSSTYAIAADAQGNSYVTGLTFDASYPTTAGALQTTCGSCSNSPDVFITKLKADGSGQVYSTFLGGNDYDEPSGIALDQNGNTIVVGRTFSKNFPLKNAVNTTALGYAMQWGFVTSITADGSGMNYSTVLGEASAVDSSASSFVNAVALDSAGNAYVTGTTNSATFPTTPGALKAFTPGYPNMAVFVSKFLSGGGLGYSSVVGNASPTNGGGGPIGPVAIAVDDAGSAYVYGKAGTLWPITSGAYQPTIPGSMPYAAPFVTKLAADGSNLDYSTFVGSGYQIGGLAVNASRQAILTGWGAEPSYPLTPDAAVKIYPGSNSSWISVLNASGTSLLYSSFITAGDAVSASMALGPEGNIWIAGSTSDSNFPLVHPVQALPGQNTYGSRTGFLMQLDATGKHTLFSTFFGSAIQGTRVSAVAIDASGKAHITGATQLDLYTTPGAYVGAVTPPPPYYTPTWPFAAKIDPGADAPSLCIDTPNNRGVGFGYVTAGYKANVTLTIRNCGTQPLSISSLTLSDPVFSIPDELNNCKSSVPADGLCTVVVQFSPVGAQTSNATLHFVTNAILPIASLPVSGIGAVPQIFTYVTTMNFDPLLVGQTSGKQFLLIENNGFAPLQINLGATTVTGDFSFVSSGCNSPLYLGQGCVFFVTFSPKNAGTQTGAISIVSNDPALPVLTINLTGTGLSAYPVPALSQITPPSVPITGTTTLYLYGSNFFPQSVAMMDGKPLKTGYQSSSTLQVTVDSSVLSGLGRANVSVFNPAPGGGESSKLPVTLYRQLAIHPAALVSVPSRKLIYAAMGTNAADSPNTVIAIDPETGDTKSSIAIGSDPRALAASDDGKYLYAALYGDQVIKRIDLATATVDRTFAYPPNQVFAQTPLTVNSMQVVPGASDSVLVAVGGMLALYRDTGLVNAVPSSYPGLTVSSFAFAGANTAYALPFTTVQNHFFNVFTLDAAGVHFTPVSGTNFGPYDQTGAQVVSDGKLLYTRAGQVWDPTGHTLNGTFPVTTYNSTSYPNFLDMVLDAEAHKTFIVGNQPYGNGSSALVLTAYDNDALKATGTVAWQSLYSASNLVRWGTDGFAFVTQDGVILVRSGIANAHLAPRAVEFGSRLVNTTVSSVVSYTNDTDSPITIGSIVVSSGFSETNTCTAVLNVGESCKITVLWQPTSTGQKSGTLTVTDSSRATAYALSLAGNAVPPVVTAPTRPSRPGRPTPGANGANPVSGESVAPTVPTDVRPTRPATPEMRLVKSSQTSSAQKMQRSHSALPVRTVVLTPSIAKSADNAGADEHAGVAEESDERANEKELRKKVRHGSSKKSRSVE